MASKLQILIETLYKGKGTQAATKDLKGLEDQTGKTTKKAGGMSIGLKDIAIAAGVAGAAMYAAKKAFDLGLEGENLIRTRDSFDALAVSIDETADGMLGKMREATMGMVSDTELMRASARTMSMGLASTGDEAAKLAEIAVALGAAMGKEAGPAMEEFGLLLANQSTLRLDTFGISAAKVKARIKELTEATPGLSRETAFMTATMEQAEISMEKLGDSIKPGEYAQAAAEVQNLTDEFKMLTSKALNPAVKAMGGFLRESRELREELKRIETAGKSLDRLAKEAGLTQKEYEKLLDQVIEYSEGSRDAETIMRREELALRALASGLRNTIQGARTYAIAQDKANISAGIMEGVWQRLKERGIEVGVIVEDVGEKTEGFTLAVEGQTGAYDDMIGPANAVTGAYENMIDKAIRTQIALDGIAEISPIAALHLGWLGDVAEIALGKMTVKNDELQALEDVLRGLSGLDAIHLDFEIGITETAIEKQQEGLEETYGAPDEPGIPEFQHGGSFVVPPGFDSKPYYIGVHSGEPVTVTPKGQQAAGGSTIIVNVYTGSGNPDIIGNKVAGRVAEVLGVRG